MRISSTIRFALAASAVTVTAQSAAAFDLKSPDFAAGSSIPQTFVLNGFGCTGQNISPSLVWRDPPAGTKSFAVFVHDPDAPTGGAGFWHWLVVDIPATVHELPRDAGKPGNPGLPAGAHQINTDFGAPGWGGPCPPQGDAAHHYNFTVYALKVDKLELPPNPTASLAGFIVHSNTIATASFTALYGR